MCIFFIFATSFTNLFGLSRLFFKSQNLFTIVEGIVNNEQFLSFGPAIAYLIVNWDWNNCKTVRLQGIESFKSEMFRY